MALKMIYIATKKNFKFQLLYCFLNESLLLELSYSAPNYFKQKQ